MSKSEVYDTDQEILAAIKELPLKEKLKTIALAHYRKLWLDKEELLNKQIDELKKYHFISILPYQKEANDIITGTRAPKKEELVHADQYLIEGEKAQQASSLTAEPIKDFWPRALLNADTIAEICSEDDLKVLEHLTKVENAYEPNSMNFTLRFHFAENDYFTNKVVEKKFIFENEDHPVRSVGTEIEWKQGRNITKKIQKKKQRNKKTGASREVEQEVEQPSFFQFFKSKFNEEETDEKAKLSMDYEIGQHLIEEVIPGALDYYLGIQHEDNDDDMMGDDGDDDDDEEEDDDA